MEKHIGASSHVIAFCTLRVILKGLARQPCRNDRAGACALSNPRRSSDGEEAPMEERIGASSHVIVFCTLRVILKGLARQPCRNDRAGSPRVVQPHAVQRRTTNTYSRLRPQVANSTGWPGARECHSNVEALSAAILAA
jgi:hypothetical protein